MEDDVLRILRLVSVDFFQIKIVRIFLILNASVIMLIQIFQAFLFLKKFEILFFVQYAPAYAMMIYILACFITIPYTTPLVFKASENFRLWQKSIKDPKIRKRILREARYVNIIFVFFLILIQISAVLHAIPHPQDSDMYFFIMIFEIYIPKFSKFLCFVIRTQMPFIALTMISPFSQLIYVCFHNKFQYYYVFLKELTSIEKVKTNQKNFHGMIKMRLLSSMVHHRRIHVENGILAKKIRYVVFIFFVTGCLFHISVIFAFLSFRELFYDFYPRLVTMGLASILLGSYVIYAGQELETITSRTYEILKMFRWYEWNSENKRIYLIFMINARKPFKIEFSENLAINYGLGLQTYKFIFSLFSILKQINNING